MAPFQIVGNPGGPQQITLTQGGALLTQLAGGQSNVIFELGGATSKETQGKADNEGLKTQGSQGQVGTSVVVEFAGVLCRCPLLYKTLKGLPPNLTS